MRRWRRLAENFGWLAGGQGLASVFTVAATAIAARTLGAEEFGVVVLVHAAALLVRQFCNFKTAEAAVRFGVFEYAQPEHGLWSRLLVSLWRLDLLGMVLAMLVMATLVIVGTVVTAWQVPATAWWYVLAATGFMAGTARGALRVLDRYAALGSVEAVAPFVRLVGVALLAWQDAPVHYFVMLHALVLWIDQIIVLPFAWRYIRHTLTGITPWRLGRIDLPIAGLRSFLVAVYWQSNVDSVLRQGPTLLVGAGLGAADAGVYRLARDVADVLRKPVALIRQAVFPDLARLWLDEPHRFLRFSLQLSGLLLVIGMGFMLLVSWFGEGVLTLLGGAQYASGALLMALLVGAAVLELPGGSLRPSIYTLGGEGLVLALSVLVLLVYGALFWWLLPWQGSLTPGYAALGAAAVSLVTYLLVLWWILRRPVNRARRQAS